MSKSLLTMKEPGGIRALGILLLLLCCAGTAWSQDRVVTGRVADDAGSGMPGVNVLVKGTSAGTTTDADGRYSLAVPASSETVLVYSFIGYLTQEQAVGSRTTVDVQLAVDVVQLSEVVVVGYGTQQKRDVTSSISSINSEAITKIPTGNTMDAMKGQIAGVDVLQTGGRPGQAPTITIRGRRSLTASNDPLFVVDGIPMTSGTTTIQDFNPSDIQSMEVLKDAASQAIYGSRGSNGVILITTKRGKPGETRVNFTTSYGISKPWRTIPMMNGEQFADLKREANRVAANGQSGRAAWGDTGSSIPSDAAVFNDAVELGSVQDGTSTDWQDLIYQNGSQLNNQLSISGGTDKSSVLFSFSNFNEKGLVEGVDYKRYTARMNADQLIGKRFKVGVSILYSNVVQNWGSGSVIPEAVNQSPLGKPYDANGNIIFLPISDGIRSNPLSELVPGKRIDERRNDRVFASAFGEVEIVPGLKFRTLLGTDLQYYRQGIFEGSFTNTRKNGTPSGAINNFRRWGYTWENYFTYTKSVGSHNFGATLLQSIADQVDDASNISAANLPFETASFNNLGLGTVTAYGSNYARYGLISYMGRVNYSYLGKYLFQASMRWDGSSRLAEGQKWSSFPGISAGWRINDEAFMSGISAVTELKLRASYGEVGNTAVPPYGTQGTLAQSYYDWNDADARGFRLFQIASPTLSWEISKSFDMGIDFAFFNGRLSGYVDAYSTSTGTSLILRRGLPQSIGYGITTSTILQNIGGTQTRGFEITLNSTILDKPNGLKWTAEFNFGSLKEKLVDLAQRGPNGEKINDVGSGWFIGEPVRVFYDYKKIGIWQADEKDQAAAFGQFPGELKLEDLNGDGVIDATNDRQVLGNDVPKAYGGLSTKLQFMGFDLGVFFYYRLGFMIDSEFSNGQATMQGRYNNLDVDYWTIDNPTNEYPRPNKNQEFIAFGSSLRYTDGSYIKLRNITLGYELPKPIVERMKMEKMRLYVTAQNPLVWSPYKLFDPERAANVTSGEMPSSQLFLGGVNISF
jgi:TonB-linked SusC/RagA family outer membrane protein